MERITQKILENQIHNLNRLYELDETTKNRFALDWAYGGVQVFLRNNESGAETSITYGHITKKEINMALTAMINTKYLMGDK